MAETQAEAGWQETGPVPGAERFMAAPTPAPPSQSQEPTAPAMSQPVPPSVGASQPVPATPQPGLDVAPEQPPATAMVGRPPTGAIHHVELWVPNLDRAIVSWGWLLTSLGYRMFQDWPGGRSWRSGYAYIVVEQSPARTASRHDRCRPGLNHLAFHVNGRELVDELTAEALLHGWKLMFPDEHPFAGGPQHYAAYLENVDGFEAELVAD
jgi:catechol 2,3-dioxygenase-like lactoylglutathione lyase family enzyme